MIKGLCRNKTTKSMHKNVKIFIFTQKSKMSVFKEAPTNYIVCSLQFFSIAFVHFLKLNIL